MAYRGEDLDLRTPQSQGTASADLGVSSQESVANGPRLRQAQRAAPIWVDDTVLDCCNLAFDVAQAHRASEVRVEHLVYALTRLDAAAEVLETLGIRVASLRREIGTVVATDIPVGLPVGRGAPHRSEGLEDVLRAAATYAYRRQAAVGVADLLQALGEANLDFVWLQRIRPFLPRPSQPVFEPYLPDLTQDRGRSGYFTAEAPRGFGTDGAPNGTNSAQSSRLDMLEQAVRTLSSELSNERKILSGVLQDLQREFMAQREDTSRLGGVTVDKLQSVFGDRLQNIEQTLLSTRSTPGTDLSLLQDRFAALERSVLSELNDVRAAIDTLAAKPADDVGQFGHRLDVIEEAVLSRDTSDRLQALETAFAADRTKSQSALEAVTQGLTTLSDSVSRHPQEVAALLQAPLTDKITALSSSLASHASRSEEADQHSTQEFNALHDALGKLGDGFNTDLGEVHEAFAKINANQHTLASSLQGQSQDVAKAFAALATRIDSLERAAAKPVEMLDALSTTVDRMHKLTVEKYYRRNRFWYWLFGTDDWLAASWPSQSARIAEELAVLKTPPLPKR